nr:MAG TPA: hypothetical protein [Caudoviricetes sp.]
MSFRRQSRWDSDMGDVADMFRNAPAASSRSKAAPLRCMALRLLRSRILGKQD